MNTYMTPGNFMCTTNNGVKTLKNCPVDNTFILKVSSPINSKNYVMQEYIDLDGIQVIRIYSAYDKTWVEKRNATKDDFKYIDVRIATSANNSIVITGAPKGSGYIPVIVAHKETNNCQDTVVCDGGTWKICSTVSQETGIRFYHMPIS